MNINQQQVETFYHVIWNQHDKSAIPGVLSESFEFRGSLGFLKQGHAGFAEYLDMVHGALADYRCDIEELVCDETRVFARMTFSGLHRAEFLGFPATGQKVSWQGAALFHFADGLVQKLWVLGDVKSLEEQLQQNSN